MQEAFQRRKETGADRSLLEVDHVWDVQLWVAAVELANRRATEGTAGPSITFNQVLYLYSIINDPSNLNVTPWRVNSVAKNKLITKFLSKFSFLRNPPAAPTWTYESILATDLTAATRDILQTPTSNGTIGQRIGRRMVYVLFETIGPALQLEDGAGTWSVDERTFFSSVFQVLRDMCSRLWPNEYRMAVRAQAEDGAA